MYHIPLYITIGTKSKIIIKMNRLKMAVLMQGNYAYQNVMTE